MDKSNYYQKNREHIRNKYHNMTDEERQKYKEYQKNYRKNMTDEERQKYKEYQKNYRKNMSDEQKQRHREARNKHDEDKYHNMTGEDIYDNSYNNVLNSVQNTKNVVPNIKNVNGQLYVSFNGNYFKQDPITIPNNVINIYVVYKLDPVKSTRNTDYTIQNALFGDMKITKNTDSSKNNYKGYGLCFDEGGEFGHTVKQGNFNRTKNAKNVITFDVDTSSSIHATNRANNIYVMGKDFIQGINDTTIYAGKLCHNNFTEFGVKFVLSLHYNDNNSYLFANGRQELKFKAKDDQITSDYV